MSKAKLHQANRAARQAEKVMRAEAQLAIRQRMDRIVRGLLDEARPMFARFPGGQWSAAEARARGVLPALGELVGRTQQLIHLELKDAICTERRKAFLAGLNATAATLEHVGRAPVISDDTIAVVTQPITVTVQGREVDIIPLEQWMRETAAADATVRWHADQAALSDGQGVSLEAPTPLLGEPADPTGTLRRVARVVIVEDGMVWLVDEVSEHDPSGRRQIFPGGKLESGEGMQAAAVREAWEETGLVVRLTSYLADFVDAYAHRRYYVAERIAGEVTDTDVDGNRPVRVLKVPIVQARGMLGSPFDVAALLMVEQDTESTPASS